MRLLRFLSGMAVAMLITSWAWGAPPTLMQVQGILTDASGIPLINTSRSVDFTIYDAAVAGAIVWGPETHPSVTTDNAGRFSHILGEHGVPITDAVFSGGTRWLGIKVGADAELTPRTRILTSGYAFRVATVDEATGGTIIGNTANPIFELFDEGTGGRMEVNDELGNIVATVESDGSGEGGFIAVTRAPFTDGIELEGNYLSTNEPRVAITGSVRSAVFNMDNVGNNSVVLPTDAVSDVEIFDEPGVANNAASGVAVPDPGPGNLLSRSITVPASGYVLVIGSLDASISHVTGTSSNYAFGVSDISATIPTNLDIQVLIPSGIASATWDFPVTSQAIFPVVGAGTYTFYFVATEFSGGGSCTAFDMQLSLMYVPTAYGATVDPTPAAMAAMTGAQGNDPSQVSSLLTPAEMAAEQAQAKAFNLERLEKELTAMKTQLDELKKQEGLEQDGSSGVQPEQQ